jgi:hypothetical protein
MVVEKFTLIAAAPDAPSPSKSGPQRSCATGWSWQLSSTQRQFCIGTASAEFERLDGLYDRHVVVFRAVHPRTDGPHLQSFVDLPLEFPTWNLTALVSRLTTLATVRESAALLLRASITFRLARSEPKRFGRGIRNSRGIFRWESMTRKAKRTYGIRRGSRKVGKRTAYLLNARPGKRD